MGSLRESEPTRYRGRFWVYNRRMLKDRIAAALPELHERYRGLGEGRVASYIPQLAIANTTWFSICAATVDGEQFAVGDADARFTLQSISKPFVFGLALEDHGRDRISERVGVEPTGDAFNSIIRLDDRSHRPHNPMVNAGAIAVTSSLKGGGPTERLNRMLELFGRYLVHDDTVDMSVFM